MNISTGMSFKFEFKFPRNSTDVLYSSADNHLHKISNFMAVSFPI